MTTSMPEFPRCPVTGHFLVNQELTDWLFPESNWVSYGSKQAVKANLDNFGIPNPPPDYLTYRGFPVELPPKQGDSMLNHMESIAHQLADYWIILADQLSKVSLPVMPDKIIRLAGWTRYQPGLDPEQVDHPLESALVFDVETMVKHGNRVVLASAASELAWYVWLHPALCGDSGLATRAQFDDRLIPIGNQKLIVGHSVGFDRSYIQEEYRINYGLDNVFLDTQSMHTAVAGLSNQQRGAYLKMRKDKIGSQEYPDNDWDFSHDIPYTADWMDFGTMTNLVDAYNLHVKPDKPLVDSDKTLRNFFVVANDLDVILEEFDSLVRYNMLDVKYTHELYRSVYPKYRLFNPSVVSLVGSMIMGSYRLPLCPDFNQWLQRVNFEYKERIASLSDRLVNLVKQVIKLWETGELNPDDPWLSQLDWTPLKSGAYKGLPMWYRDIKVKLKKSGKIGLTLRVVPYLLRLSWDGKPLRYFAKTGWVYRADADDTSKLTIEIDGELWRKLPHKNGDKANCGNPLGKDYLPLVENGSLSSSEPDCLDLLKSASALTYWTSIQERVNSMKVVRGYNPETDDRDTLIYLPQQATHRTITRRAGDRLIYTSSKAKKTRLGSEFRSRVHAPVGHSLIMADFDSQELRLGAMMGDAKYGVHGATPMSYGVIAGSKERGDDPHTLLAKSVGGGVTRDDAKVYKYATLYGAGETGLANYIKAGNPVFTSEQCRGIAKKAQGHMKGKRIAVDDYGILQPTWKVYRGSKAVWQGGTDSDCYNFMEVVANSAHPATPLLGCRITEALVPSRVKGEYLTSRVNWVIQSSGVDILHLFLVGLMWLFRLNQVSATVIQSLHDEVVSVAARGSEAVAVRCYNIAHLWAWATASENLGILSLPEAYAWFSGVGVDVCWRKSPTASQVTPSNQEVLPDGLELNPEKSFQVNLQEYLDSQITW